MSEDSLPEAWMIEDETKHDLEVASVVGDCVIKFWGYFSQTRKVLPTYAREVVVLNMITSVPKGIIDRTVV
jgi:hypothetical protein